MPEGLVSWVADRRGSPERLADHRLRMHVGTEEISGHASDFAALLVERARPGDRGGGADVLEIRRLELLPEPAAEHGDIGTLPAAVGVQLVEDEELQPLGRFDQPLLADPR